MTDDMIRDVYKNDDLKELEILYRKTDAEVDNAKGRRTAFLFLGFFIAHLILFYAIIRPDSFIAVVVILLMTLFLSPFSTLLHFYIFSQFFHKQQVENNRREEVLKRIQFAKERESRNTPYHQGWSAGYDTGYAKGHDEGYALGNKAGNYEGYEDGYKKGYENGRGTGLDFLCREGLCEGYGKGYSKGYHDARIDLENGVYEDDYDGDDADDDDDGYLDSFIFDESNS
jgi:hypothetical protein